MSEASASGEAQEPSDDFAEWRAGWPTLFGATAAVATGGSLFIYAAGYFVKPIEHAEGWSRSQIGFGTTIAMLTGAVMMPVFGALADRYGAALIGLVTTAGYGALCLLLSLIPARLPIYYAMLIIIAVFYAGTSVVTFSRLVASSFRRWRGAALGVLMCGTGLVFAPLAPALNGLIALHGWRAGYAALGVAALLVGLPGALVAAFRRSGSSKTPSPSNTGVDGLLAAMKTSIYWRLMLGVATATIALGGFLNQAAALFSDRGMTVREVGALGSVFAIMIVAGRAGVGVLLDLLPPQLVGFAMMTGGAVGAWLLHSPQTPGGVSVLAVSLLGWAMGATGDVEAFFAAREFGLPAFSKIFGTYCMCTSIGLGAGALLFSALHDMYQGYGTATEAATGLFMVAGLLFGSLPSRS